MVSPERAGVAKTSLELVSSSGAHVSSAAAVTAIPASASAAGCAPESTGVTTADCAAASRTAAARAAPDRTAAPIPTAAAGTDIAAITIAAAGTAADVAAVSLANALPRWGFTARFRSRGALDIALLAAFTSGFACLGPLRWRQGIRSASSYVYLQGGQQLFLRLNEREPVFQRLVITFLIDRTPNITSLRCCQQAALTPGFTAITALPAHFYPTLQNQHGALRAGNDPKVESCAPHGHGCGRRVDGIGALFTLAGNEPKTATQGLDREILGLSVAAQHCHIQHHARVRPDGNLGFVNENKLNHAAAVGRNGIPRGDPHSSPQRLGLSRARDLCALFDADDFPDFR